MIESEEDLGGLWTENLKTVAKLFTKRRPRRSSFRNLARVVQKVDNTVHRLNQYPADSAGFFVNTKPMESDLSGG